jgi:membrane protein DedA with SNARE-associated domain
MSAAVPTVATVATPSGAAGDAVVAPQLKTALISAAVIRGALSLVAIPLAPLLFRRHFLTLVLLRPTKEVLLAAGFRVRSGDVALPLVYAAAVPLAVGGVWLFYWLGRVFAPDLADDDADLPRVVRRVLPRDRIRRLRGVLDSKGAKVVFFGRLAVFPSSLMAAAAGAAGVAPRKFLVADGLGALVSVTEVVAVGFALDEAYEHAGAWLTAAGAVVALGLLFAMGRWLRRESGGDGGRKA